MSEAEVEPRPSCKGCGEEIDPDCCWCGSPESDSEHGPHWQNYTHPFVPYGCTCLMDRAKPQQEQT